MSENAVRLKLRLLCCSLALVVVTALAHPGASIHVAADGRVVFVDTGGGMFVIERNGRLVRHPGPAFLGSVNGLAADDKGALYFSLDRAIRTASTRELQRRDLRAPG